MRKLIFLLLFSLLFTFCQRKKSFINNSVINSHIGIDTINQFEKLAIENDTLEYINFEPFIFLKSGTYFGKNKKTISRLV